MHFILVIWIAVFSPSVKSQMTPSDSYSHSTMLQSGKILLYWKYTDSHITFEVIGQTTGWIGIGFSSNGAMTASDIVVGWVKNGAVTVTDRHGGSSNTYPPIDPQQNIEVLGGKELDGWTMIKFSRQIAACEEEYDREISTNTERLIWACGNTDPTGDDLVSGDYHNTDRGVESIYFFEPSTNFADLPTGPTYDTFDVLASNFLIPAERTYYNCILYKLPDFGGKQHIVKWEPVIQLGNEPYLHHMLIYRCGDIMENESELAKDDRCYSPNMAHFDTCTTIVFEWLLGAGAMTFPAEAGFPVGGPGDPVYVQLEIHYNNPNMVAGVRDNSGYRFTYTPTLRKYDVGVLQIGNYVNPKEHFIPPGAESFKSIAHCTNECVKSRMSVSETDHVTAFSVVLHSHEAGRKMRLRHLRNGTELPYLASDENYDFNYQEARYLNPSVSLQSTDNFQLECDYNTEGRVAITEAGLGVREEMCLAFISYYPKIDLSFCQSSVTMYASWQYLDIDMTKVNKVENTPGAILSHFQLTGPSNVAGKTVFEYMNELNWTQQKIEDFESFYNAAQHHGFCIPSNVSETTVTPFEPISIETPYVSPRKECLVGLPTPSSQTTSHGHKTTSSAIILLGILSLIFMLIV